MRRILPLCALALAAPVAAKAQRFEPNPDFVRSRWYLGATGAYAVPQGEFAQFVTRAYGINGHAIYALDREGVLSLRADVGYLNYGNEHKRVPLSPTLGGRLLVDLNTTNNIVMAGIGPQLMVPNGTLRPYVAGAVGFSYFYTQSEVAGTDGGTFASSTNFDDGSLAWSAAAGIYVPLHHGHHPVSLDVGMRYHWNGTMTYLKRGGITDGANNTIFVDPIRSRADFLVWHVGASFGV
ncbi:MAG: hypothetical protein M3081_21020 [Gemmatimonadota bacterium]|nr:hypothetical protein [Gemmatimonadota bacterium]